jgi:hypothetical protein
MPARLSKFTSPRLELEITDEQWQNAVQSQSGGCLIADAIKHQYPQLSRIVVDMATIRASDQKRGLRFNYLTPADAQHCLLAFDQGWRNPIKRPIKVRRAVKVDRITKSPKERGEAAEYRKNRVADLEAREAAGEPLSRSDKAALTRMRRQPKSSVERPASKGPIEIHERNGALTVYGGRPLPQGRPHPNLLRGRDRHFGAKLADPGVAFREAVEEALKNELAQREAETAG